MKILIDTLKMVDELMDMRKYLFLHRTINERNILSTDCGNASSCSMCKTTELTGIRQR